jgi:hypothetical protein
MSDKKRKNRNGQPARVEALEEDSREALERGLKELEDAVAESQGHGQAEAPVTAVPPPVRRIVHMGTQVVSVFGVEEDGNILASQQFRADIGRMDEASAMQLLVSFRQFRDKLSRELEAANPPQPQVSQAAERE